MTREGPLHIVLALAGILTVWAAYRCPEASPGSEAPPSTLPIPGASLLLDLQVLDLRAHAAAERLAEWDVGVAPLPKPRRWGRR